MTTFAQVYDGCAHNIVIGSDFDSAMDGKFAPAYVKSEIAAGRSWSEVPDGTLHGATANGDGTFTNPTPLVPTPVPLAINKAQFQALYAQNGNDLNQTLANWPTG
jgi:hypothetical protein